MSVIKNFNEYSLVEKSASLPFGYWYSSGQPLFTADILANHVVRELMNSRNPTSLNSKLDKSQVEKVSSGSYDIMSSLGLIPSGVPREEMITKIKQQVYYMINTPKEGEQNKVILAHYGEAGAALDRARKSIRP
jgi:hypothetical protein